MAFRYVERKGPKAKKRPGKSYVAKGKKPKLGAGGRFKALTGALEKKGARSPKALAAWIGRKKLGTAKMGKLAGAERHRAAMKRGK